MFTFSYWSNKKKAHEEKIFECQAENILEADKKLEEATQLIASKCNWIGCIVS
jgi:hypothetical protein